MAGYRYPTADELAPTEKERQAARTAAGAQQTGAAWGSGIGGVAGGALGALGLLVPGLGEVTIPAGIAAGAGLGGAIGGSIGSGAAENADAVLSAGELARQKKVTALQLRQQALDRLEGVG